MPEDTPSPHTRKITVRRDTSNTDPFRRYFDTTRQPPQSYRVLTDPVSGEPFGFNLPPFFPENFVVVPVSAENSGHIGDAESRRPTIEPPNSFTINWSWPGYNRNVDTGILSYSPATTQNATEYNSAINGDTVPITSHPRRGDLNFSQSMPGPFGQLSDYNVATSIAALGTSASIERMPAEQEVAYMRNIPFTRNSPQIIRQLAAIGTTPALFEDNNSNWRTPPGRDRPVPPASAHAVQLIIDEEHSPHTAKKAALAAYGDSAYYVQSSASYVDYEYYDFSVTAPYILDWLSHNANIAGDRTDTAALSPAFINPEYNYYNESYEQAISAPNIPETVLPNMYVYSLITDEPGLGLGDAPSWQTGSTDRRAAELQGNYDRKITLDEFDNSILPRTTDEDFVSYIESYSAAVANGNVSVDMYKNLDRENADTITPSGDMDIYPKFNTAKAAFPMYIEVGIPTNKIGPIGKMMERTKTSSAFMNSLIAATPVANTELQCTSTGFALPNPDPNPFSWGSFFNRPVLRNYIRSRQVTKSYDFDDFFDNVASDAVMSVLTARGDDYPVGVDPEACLDYMTELALTGMRESIRAAGAENVIPYNLRLLGNFRESLCKAETIVYKLVKRKKVDGSFEDIQNYFFPNTSYTEIINFVDTQVKFNQIYHYELYAYAVVYGAKYRFRTRNQSGRTVAAVGHPIYHSFNVETLPSIKIVEYPVFTKSWSHGLRIGHTRWWEPPPTAGGLNYPETKIMDRPPLPPLVDIFPYKTNHKQILINLNVAVGAYMGKNTIPYKTISGEEQTFFRNLSIHQKINENFDLPYGNLEFRSEGAEEVKRMEIYRTDTLLPGTITPALIYTNFDSNLHRVLDLTADPEISDDVATAFDFVDNLEPNKTYYYTFRSIDIHGLMSNPTEIYEVLLEYDKGLFLPHIRIYDPKPISSKVPSREVTRFLEISAADLQSLPFYETYDNSQDQFYQNQTKGLVSEEEDKVQNNHFIVRLTSKATGRKIDLRLNFNTREVVEDT
jgi:hypothetical protein